MNTTEQGLIRLNGVTKVFYTDEVETHALSGVHLEIKNGEFLSIRQTMNKIPARTRIHQFHPRPLETFKTTLLYCQAPPQYHLTTVLIAIQALGPATKRQS